MSIAWPGSGPLLRATRAQGRRWVRADGASGRLARARARARWGAAPPAAQAARRRAIARLPRGAGRSNYFIRHVTDRPAFRFRVAACRSLASPSSKRSVCVRGWDAASRMLRPHNAPSTTETLTMTRPIRHAAVRPSASRAAVGRIASPRPTPHLGCGSAPAERSAAGDQPRGWHQPCADLGQGRPVARASDRARDVNCHTPSATGIPSSFSCSRVVTPANLGSAPLNVVRDSG